MSDLGKAVANAKETIATLAEEIEGLSDGIKADSEIRLVDILPVAFKLLIHILGGSGCVERNQSNY